MIGSESLVEIHMLLSIFGSECIRTQRVLTVGMSVILLFFAISGINTEKMEIILSILKNIIEKRKNRDDKYYLYNWSK